MFGHLDGDMQERNINGGVMLGFLGRIKGRMGEVLFYWADSAKNQSFFERRQHETYTMAIFCISCIAKNWEQGVEKLMIQGWRHEKEPRRRGQIGCNR